MAFAEVFADMGWSLCVPNLPAELAAQTCLFGGDRDSLFTHPQGQENPMPDFLQETRDFNDLTAMSQSLLLLVRPRGLILELAVMAVGMALLEGWPWVG